MIVAYQEDDGKSLRVIRRAGTEEVMLSEDRLDLHDVLALENKVYVVATETNSVVMLDPHLVQIDSWRLPGENDAAHLNSVAFYDGKLLASAFGRFEHHREYKNGTVGCGIVIDIQTGETYLDGLSQPHSLTVIDDLLYLCNSEERQLRIYRGKKLLQRVDLPGYTRGIAFSAGYLYVGLSLSRNAQSVDDRQVSAAIVVLDRETLRQEEYFSIPSREIYDIRLLDISAAMLPYLLTDSVAENQKMAESLALYRRGYEAYERYNEPYKAMLMQANAQLDQTSKELSLAQEMLNLTKDALSQSRGELDQASKELSQTKEMLNLTKKVLSQSRAEQELTGKALNQSKMELDEVRADLERVCAELEVSWSVQFHRRMQRLKQFIYRK